MYICGNEKMSDCFQGFCMEMTIEIIKGVVITSRLMNAYKNTSLNANVSSLQLVEITTQTVQEFIKCFTCIMTYQKCMHICVSVYVCGVVKR
jgi:hypothetical protein